MGKDFTHAEWTGKHCKVMSSKNLSHNGVEGTIVDETKNVIVIQTTKGDKKVPKHGTTFSIEGNDVNGDEVLASPEERIKL